jgi:hypothetical protein
MKIEKSFKRAVPGLAIAAALAMGMPAAHAGGDADGAGDFKFALSGYARAWVSLNLENQPELKSSGQGGAFLGGASQAPFNKDSKWEASMVRGSVLLDADASYMGLKFKTIARLDREYKTDYLRDLERLRDRGQVTNTGAGAAAAYTTLGAHSTNDSILDNYNNFDFREFWVEAPIGDRVTVKFGRQQLVWGESDFFHAMDVVHGYDLSWRLFFEGENEEWRKPLILLSTKIRIPEANGMLQAFIRPGWDRCDDIGNTYDVDGGRWFFQPYRGFNLSAITTKNCNQKNWDQEDVTGGVRWQGEAFDVNYSLAYINTFSADPVANPSQHAGLTPYKGSQVDGFFFDRIHPKIDVLGATVSGYSALLDSVISVEASYTIDQPYNFGTGAFGVPNVVGNVGNGLGGIKLKDVVNVMVRMDHNLKLEDILGTTRPSFSSIQLFDTMVVDYKKSDDLVRLFAYGTQLKEHNTILTMFTVLNYMNDKINPSFVLGFDLGNGGGFAIPAVAFTLNDNWVGKVEADIFWSGGRSSTSQFGLGGPNAGPSQPRSQLFGYFDKSSQLVFRLTRQF